ncbi:MAG: polysaccharide deacetylase family protein [Sphingomonadaceae bacterium]|nr:polysaccharide deacetylase family protein [Sphingomonadaceae bacterium]
MASFRCALALLYLLIGAPLRAGDVALTFDDLPTYGRFRTVAEAQRLTGGLLDGLRRNRLPAIGFDNEKQLEGPDKAARIALLTRWLDAGMQIGNHGYAHLSLDRTPLDRYVADTARGETITRPLLAAHGETERWFRYPYLESGNSLAVRRAFEAWLTAHGYRVAPVTMENADWEFADVYDDALGRGDQAAASRARDQYLEFTAAAVAWYRKASVALFGREIRFVFLLHASQLNADSMDAIAAILANNHLKPVRLETAMRDPVYRIRDDYGGPDGDEWLSRWSFTFHKDLPFESFPAVPAGIDATEKALTR